MSLKTRISPELWDAVSGSYEAGNYSHAITDAMSYVTDVLRDKSGLDGDGRRLVGQALGFGGDSLPRIRVNRLQTQTERDEQEGLREVLSGMYALVRNTRSHEKVTDTQETADTLICFIEYVLGFLGQSLQSFTIQGFVESVTEPHFVPDSEYVGGLIEWIPVRKRLDTLIALWREKTWTNSDRIKLVVGAILQDADESTTDAFLAFVSDELMKADDEGEVSIVINILPDDMWPRLSKMARLRAEHMLTEQMEGAWYIPERNETYPAAGTWIPDLAQHFLRKDQLRQVILAELRHSDFRQHNFVFGYFLWNLPYIFETGTQLGICVKAIADSVRKGNQYAKNRLVECLEGLPVEWVKSLIHELQDLTDPENPELRLGDGTPFLGRFGPQPNPASLPGFVEEDDIPF